MMLHKENDYGPENLAEKGARKNVASPATSLSCPVLSCVHCGVWVLLQNHLEERLLDQAQAWALYTPPVWGSQHTPRHDIGCPTPWKIIILPNKTIPHGFFDSETSIP